jgi:hypothetical protein
MTHKELGRFVMAGGGLVFLIGLLIYAGGLRWFGRLPGDIRLEGDQARVYVPWVSMLVVSAVLSALLSLARRLF